jgi:uncharacterized protein
MVHTGQALTLVQLRSVRQEIICTAAARGAYNVRVFGSVARGKACPESDVDFLVDMEKGRSVLDLSELILDLQELLGRDVDVFVFRRPGEFVRRIQGEAVPL